MSKWAFSHLQQREQRAKPYFLFPLGTQSDHICQHPPPLTPPALDVALRLSPGQGSVGRNESHHFQARSLSSAHTVTRVIHMSLVPSHPPTGHRGATGKLEALRIPWMEGAVSRIPYGEQDPVPTPEATPFRLWVACLLC